MTSEGDKKQTAGEIAGSNRETLDRSLGDILRRAREDLGMDLAQLSETTRIRPPILESLENEEWDNLGAPVFVRGFLKSYARAVMLSEKDILRIYGQKGPDQSFAPKPLASLTPPRKKTPVALFLFLILFVGLAFFSWHRYDLFHGSGEPLMPDQGSKGEIDRVNERPKAEALPGVAVVKSDEHLSDSSLAQTEQAPKKTDRAAISNEKIPNAASQEAIAPPLVREVPPKIGTGAESDSKTQTLAADIRETTWIKVIVDDAPPKEYILRPGDHTEWKATKGFEVVIGNAGGIALVFNGQKLDNLGKHGKVISLRLPEKKERSSSN